MNPGEGRGPGPRSGLESGNPGAGTSPLWPTVWLWAGPLSGLGLPICEGTAPKTPSTSFKQGCPVWSHDSGLGTHVALSSNPASSVGSPGRGPGLSEPLPPDCAQGEGCWRGRTTDMRPWAAGASRAKKRWARPGPHPLLCRPLMATHRDPLEEQEDPQMWREMGLLLRAQQPSWVSGPGTLTSVIEHTGRGAARPADRAAPRKQVSPSCQDAKPVRRELKSWGWGRYAAEGCPG